MADNRQRARELEREVAKLQEKLKEYVKIGSGKHEKYMVVERNKVNEVVSKETQNNLDRVKHEVTREIVGTLFGVVAITMHDKQGWGKKRIHKLLEQLESQIVCVGDGLLSFADIKSMVDEIGIDIQEVSA